eukprot:gene57865-79292_t
MFDYIAEYLTKFEKDENALFLEFGVASGHSINYFSSKTSKTFYGFDSFEGMPEEWKGWNVVKGQFSTDGKLPKVNSNVKLIKGLVQDTIPPFLKEHPEKKIAFIHVDTDTYIPAKIILQLCKSKLASGSLILFDELHSYASWKQHEFKALQEEMNANDYTFKAIQEFDQSKTVLMGFFKEFKEFASKGNFLDIATAFVMGAAFNKIVT